jgi:hypothetical protein
MHWMEAGICYVQFSMLSKFKLLWAPFVSLNFEELESN